MPIKSNPLQSRYDYNRNLIALRIWAGGLSIADIEEIDTWFTPANSEQTRQDFPRKPRNVREIN